PESHSRRAQTNRYQPAAALELRQSGVNGAPLTDIINFQLYLLRNWLTAFCLLLNCHDLAVTESSVLHPNFPRSICQENSTFEHDEFSRSLQPC
ncbi:hypothetical protein, partial [Roseovarius marisflavi]|uniref:hypothetical protein n=1 Tax=Roseovarius marisflavi TaxID=1054996 RepID=UPI001C6582F9